MQPNNKISVTKFVWVALSNAYFLTCTQLSRLSCHWYSHSRSALTSKCSRLTVPTLKFANQDGSTQLAITLVLLRSTISHSQLMLTTDSLSFFHRNITVPIFFLVTGFLPLFLMTSLTLQRSVSQTLYNAQSAQSLD